MASYYCLKGHDSDVTSQPNFLGFLNPWLIFVISLAHDSFTFYTRLLQHGTWQVWDNLNLMAISKITIGQYAPWWMTYLKHWLQVSHFVLVVAHWHWNVLMLKVSMFWCYHVDVRFRSTHYHWNFDHFKLATNFCFKCIILHYAFCFVIVCTDTPITQTKHIWVSHNIW